MRETRRRSGKRVIQQHLLGSVGKMICAADDMRDTHVDVIHHYAELVSRQSRRAEKDEVLYLGILHLSRAKNGVLEMSNASSRSSEADGIRRAFADFSFTLCRR